MTDKSNIPAQNIRLEAVLTEYLRLEKGPGSKVAKLTNAFIKTIEAGFWRPNDRIPTETALTKVLPLSLGTIQSALRRLVDEGIIERRRGLGSRIADISNSGQEAWWLRFQDLDSDGYPSLENISIEISETDAQGPWADFLDRSPTYIKVKRTLGKPGEFLILGELYLSAGRFRPLLDYDPETFNRLHLRHVLQHRFNAPTLSFDQNIRVIQLTDRVTSLLKLAPGSAGLEMEIFCRTFRSEPLFYQKFTIPPTNRWINLRIQQG